MTSIAIILVDLDRGRFGHAAALSADLAGRPVLQHTIDRVSRIAGVEGIVLLHPEGQSLDGMYAAPEGSPAIESQVMQVREGDAWLGRVIDAGRKWALTAWRGGIGGMTVYDELLPAYPVRQAMRAAGAESAVVVRGDWCCVDPKLASEQLRVHRSAPEAMKLTFTQAPPGLSPLVVHHSVLADMVEHSATVANLICYNPKKPTIDPVGKDVNVSVPASVRDQYRRFIFDTPRAIEHIRAIAEHLGDALIEQDAAGITDASRAVERGQPWRQLERLPQQVNIELTPRRSVDGPIVPQHHLDLGRGDMSAETIDALFDSLGRARLRPSRESPGATGSAGASPSPFHVASPSPLHGDMPSPFHGTSAGQGYVELDGNGGRAAIDNDTAVLFGGLGDALLHEQWHETIERATRAGLLGVGVETDLLIGEEELTRLAALPLDVIAVRINADTAATYEQLMGTDGFGTVMENLKSLFRLRNTNRQNNTGFQGWVVPRLVKVAENLADMETFFERWMTIAGWAVVDRALTGRGLIPDMSPVPMEVPRPPGRGPELHRIKQRLTLLSDGRVCLCGQDWLGRAALGSVGEKPLAELWRSAPGLLERAGHEQVICPVCAGWLEAQGALLTGVGSTEHDA